MQLNEATPEQLESAMSYLQSRLATCTSKMMRSAILKDIAMVQAELDSRKPKTPAVRLYSLGGDVFTTKVPDCPECGLKLRADETCGFCQ